MNSVDFETVKSKLTPPVDRMAVVEIIANGQNIPQKVKVLVYTLLQTMPQSEVDRLALLARQAVIFLEQNDTEGLKQFLQTCNIPEPIAGLIRNYGSNLIKKQ